ncbi:DUF1028 domain-containing protein [Pseudonocardia alaniniphila]|uniref:DUF1028 domain-containing protein n=1 Tax=Pseudonocardia alaniniphila TaxID=75291 RepID=A0ABS9TTY8_9PSEU|nr:DUF1028 domain-containing protein [Pseudonocardia alaniniphila]MCH6171967.1 DUF1028 domain-containing protein [Pseudonocardia alaniniphila]
MTYSIVARDPGTGQLGVGSQSHFFGVGRVVGWAASGVGAVATQAFVNVGYGPASLEALARGLPAQEVVDTVTAADELRGYRQLGVVDACGTAASFTGESCAPAAGGLVGDGVAVQGNMLGSERVWPAMLEAYESTGGDLADRLLAALAAAEEAGGDVRGSQSAVLKVVSGERSDTPWAETVVDIRVDDHPDPVGELARLLPRQRAFDLIGGVIFAPDLMIGPYRRVPPELLAEKLTGLAEAAELLGAGNREADFWRALLLARSGDRETARALFDDLFAARPRLRGFLAGIAPLGFLDDVEEYV